MDSSKYVITLSPNDVLLGRGAPIIQWKGNVRFRELIYTRKAEYTGTGRHHIKDMVAKSIVREIGERAGRFLRRVPASTAQELGYPADTKVWENASDAVALEKVKQALRDRDPIKIRRALGGDSESSSQSSGGVLPPTLTGSMRLASGLQQQNQAMVLKAQQQQQLLSLLVQQQNQRVCLPSLLTSASPSLTTAYAPTGVPSLLVGSIPSQQQQLLILGAGKRSL